jgi:cytochrome c oxidase assembly protein subunit 15
MHPVRRVRLLRACALGSAVSVFGTMVLGGYTSAVGAGLACPDWPLCNNAVLPDLANPAVAAEFAHRMFAVSATALILSSLLLTFLWFRRDRRLLVLSGVSFALLSGQVALGALTITSRLDPVIVTSHLAIATSTFAATLSLAWVSLLSPPGGRRGEAVPS